MHRKEYVKVNLTVDEEGNVQPTSIVFQKFKTYEIDKVKHICHASATKVGGAGLRYTVVILGKETYLYEAGGRWFVEARVPC